jgi:hypothetical protein
LLKAPQPASAPAIAGGGDAGTTLSCSQGTWASDAAGSFVYKAPQRFSYQWTRDGVDVAGATQSTLTAATGGDYRCRVTAENHAGAATQTSEPHRVAPPIPPPDVSPKFFGPVTDVTLALAPGRATAHDRLATRIANANEFAISGTLTARTAKPLAAAHGRRVALKRKAFVVPARGALTVKLVLPRVLQRVLVQRRRLAFAVTLDVVDAGGHHRSVRKTLVLALKR